jgi:hypothetical protein
MGAGSCGLVVQVHPENDPCSHQGRGHVDRTAWARVATSTATGGGNEAPAAGRGTFGASLRGWISPAHPAQVIRGQTQVVQFIMFASLYFVGQAETSSCLYRITQPGQSTKVLANMWANSLQPAKLRPGQPCSRDTTFSVVSLGPGRGALFVCRGDRLARGPAWQTRQIACRERSRAAQPPWQTRSLMPAASCARSAVSFCGACWVAGW